MDFNHDFNKEHCVARIRQKLQDDGVKLWISPYFKDNKPVVEKLEELAMHLSDILAIPCNTILNMLTSLQSHAVEKLASRIQFQQTGLATLRAKIVGETRMQKDIVAFLSESGDSLKRRILSEMNQPSTTRLKLICSGLILDGSKSLEAQKVSNNSQILAIILPLDSKETEEKIYQEVEMIKADADLVSSREDGNYLSIADQSGNIIDLPFEEKKSLAVAMALHEKGRSALKRNQVSLALTLLHEADSKFHACRSELLRAVDNAALLSLDIAWCYLLLGNAADIPDAAVRLNKCEQSLYKTYGSQMERLLTLKGSTGKEAVLFLRLHLLQGVVAFHQGKTFESIKLLNQAKEEIGKLKINDEDLTHLIGLGYHLSDARLSLRACGGDLEAAILYLQRLESEREERLKKEEAEEERDRQRKELGKTANNQWVNLGYLQSIVQMGFQRSRVAEGLKKTNNDINKTLEFLQNDDESFNPPENDFTEESLAQVISMGFSVESSKKMLEKHNGNVELAVEELSSNLGRSDDQPITGISRESLKLLEDTKKRLEMLLGTLMISMGFSVEILQKMLEKHNGNVEPAVEELASNFGRSDGQPIAGSSRDSEKLLEDANKKSIEMILSILMMSMSFSIESSEKMLEKQYGDLERSVEVLSSNIGRSGDQPITGTTRNSDMLLEETKKSIEKLLGSLRDRKSLLETSRKRKEESELERAAYKRLAKDIPRTEEDHLDTGLELESEYLTKYLSFFNS